MNIDRRVAEAFAQVALDHVFARYFGKTVHRNEIVRRLGEEVAEAWDNVQAAVAAYNAAVNKSVNRRHGKDA